MDKDTLNLIMVLIISAITLIAIVLGIILIVKIIKKGDIVIEENIESDSNIDSVKYYIVLKNIRKKQVTVKDFGVIISPYKVPLLKSHFSLSEQGNLEIMSKDVVKVDLSYLINSKALQYSKGKIYFYYEDAYSDRYEFKSKMLKKYRKIEK